MHTKCIGMVSASQTCWVTDPYLQIFFFSQTLILCHINFLPNQRGKIIQTQINSTKFVKKKLIVINRHTIFPKGKPGRLLIEKKFVSKNKSSLEVLTSNLPRISWFWSRKKVFFKKKVFTSNTSWIAWYGLHVLYQVYMFGKFCHVVADPLCSHHGPQFGKPWKR